MAVVEKANFCIKDNLGILETGSQEYKEKVKNIIKSLSDKGITGGSILYAIDNNWDLSRPSSREYANDRIVCLRLSQPISATKVSIMLGDKISEEYA